MSNAKCKNANCQMPNAKCQMPNVKCQNYWHQLVNNTSWIQTFVTNIQTEELSILVVLYYISFTLFHFCFNAQQPFIPLWNQKTFCTCELAKAQPKHARPLRNLKNYINQLRHMSISKLSHLVVTQKSQNKNIAKAQRTSPGR